MSVVLHGLGFWPFLLDLSADTLGAVPRRGRTAANPFPTQPPLPAHRRQRGIIGPDRPGTSLGFSGIAACSALGAGL